MDRIIRGPELHEFAAMLMPHQKATTADGEYGILMKILICIPFDSSASCERTSLLRSCFLGCHAMTIGGASLRDIPKKKL